jgi:hypothetical protein
VKINSNAYLFLAVQEMCEWERAGRNGRTVRRDDVIESLVGNVRETP